MSEKTDFYCVRPWTLQIMLVTSAGIAFTDAQVHVGNEEISLHPHCPCFKNF